jgi:hypothetical protein
MIAGYSFSSEFNQIQLLKTLDGGATWNLMRTPFTNSTLQYGFGLWFEPNGSEGFLWGVVTPTGFPLKDPPSGLLHNVVWRTSDGGRNWALVADTNRDKIFSLNFSANLRQGWMVTQAGMYATIQPDEPPKVLHFSVSRETGTIKLDIKPGSVPMQLIYARVEISGPGIAFAYDDKVRRSFRAETVSSVEPFPANGFGAGQDYVAHLVVDDGWNIVVLDTIVGTEWISD